LAQAALENGETVDDRGVCPWYADGYTFIATCEPPSPLRESGARLQLECGAITGADELTDFSIWAHASALGIVEGVTEFLPVSSTGHLILAGYFIGFPEELGKIFEVVIQLGAILAIVVQYWRKLWGSVLNLPRAAKARHFALSIIVAFLPAALLGAALHDLI